MLRLRCSLVYRSPDDGADEPGARTVSASLEQLLAGYGGAVAVHVASLALYGSTVYGLVGANGAGKSTLLRTLAGLQRPLRGVVRIGSNALYGGAVGLADDVGWMPDNAPLRDSMTVRATLEASPRHTPVELDALTRRLGIDRLLERNCVELSLGQRQRVALARVLLGRAPLLLLDEPTNGVDPEGRELLAILLRERARAGATVVVSSHAIRELEAFCDEFIVMSRGRVHSAGKPSEILTGEPTSGVRVRARWMIGRRTDRGEDALPALEDAEREARRVIAAIEGGTVVRADEDALELSLPDNAEAHRAALLALVSARLPLVTFEPVRSSLADAFARAAKER
jgi:ABC-type multidrug transport system ATPase subunit